MAIGSKLMITIGLLLLVVALLVVCAVFVSIGASHIDKINHHKKDPHLHDARKQLVWASVVGWFSVVIVCGLTGVYLYFGPELALIAGGLIDYALLGLAMTLTIICGSLAAAGAANIHQTIKNPSDALYFESADQAEQDGFDQTNSKSLKNAKEAYKDAIIAACVALGGSGILLFALLFHMFYHPKTDAEKIEDLKKEERKVKLEDAKQKIEAQQEVVKAKKEAVEAKKHK